MHFYNSVSVLQREVAFRKGDSGIKKLATDAAALCKELEAEAKGIDLYYEYSPESFTRTEPEYAVEACNAGQSTSSSRRRNIRLYYYPAGNRGNDHAERLSPTRSSTRLFTSYRATPWWSRGIRTTMQGMGVAATEQAVPAGADGAQKAACWVTASVPVTLTFSTLVCRLPYFSHSFY